MVRRRDAFKGCHALPVEVPSVFINRIVILIIQDARGKGEYPVGELLLHPVIAFRVFPLKAHSDRHRLAGHGHHQRHHCPVILHAPHGFHAVLDNVQLIKGKEQIQIILRLHRFFPDEMVFWKMQRITTKLRGWHS